jgi:HAE1 family hydrophobic/amphiphilic exporter-1
VSLFGARKRNIRIWIDPAALRARQLAVSDVLGALRREHVERPGGFVEGHAVEWALKTDAEFRSVGRAREHDRLVGRRGADPARATCARLEDGGEDVRDATYMNGKNGHRARPHQAVAREHGRDRRRVLQRMDAVRGRTPDGISISKKEGFIDYSRTIRESFEETMFALVFGGLLAVLVVFVFMRRSRPTMIVAAAIHSR